LHRDIKSANILLDENFNAKISDFGLSIRGPANVQSTFITTTPCGTFGYIDPEYYTTYHLTQKSDVFSFGVVLFEVLCGRIAYLPKYEDDRVFLSVLAQKHYKRKTLEKIIHSDLQNQINAASLHIFSTIACQCLKNANERPTMKEVVKQLERAILNQQAPSGIWSDIYDGFSDAEDGNFAAHQQSEYLFFTKLFSFFSLNY
nr:receptor-like protein kinase HERK 1 [Tanacetum cinerariifolium]